MTTRKIFAPAAVALLGLVGCATPGPLHVYALATGEATSIVDSAGADSVELPSFLAPGETVTGFAFDPFTDHFFLRLAPGNRIRVVDRPARAVKREFTAEKLPATGGGDLAVRPRDGHLFFIVPSEAALVETDRFGKFIRKIVLPDRAGGVACDIKNDELIVLYAAGRTAARIDRTGKAVTPFPLSHPIASRALGYDSERREFYAPLFEGKEIGVFSAHGQLQRTIPVSAKFLDVGPRSFLRMF